MASFDLIIFDCDGTLIDSEYVHNLVISEQLAAKGYPQFTLDYCLEHFAGKGMDAVVRLIEDATGAPIWDSFMPDYVGEVVKRFRTETRVIDGVIETLGGLHGTLPICVASNGEVDNVLASLRAGGLDKFFPADCIFTKAQVVNPKPAPDLFLFAAKTMGAAPSRTLVIEDSVTGARAGIAAGMTVVGFTAAAHDVPAQEAALRAEGVHHLLHDFADIAALVSGAKAARSA